MGGALLGAAPAFADPIGDAAKKLAEASYPFAKEVDWNNGIYLQAPGKVAPLDALKAIDKMIVLGAQADPKLSDAAYPFMKGVDWTSNLYTKPLPGVSANQALKAVDKAIVLGSALDGNLLKAAAEAHHKAIGSIDGQGVTSAADYEAVNAALGRVVASVPTSKTMDVYNAWAGLA